jgi:hypothetical protein
MNNSQAEQPASSGMRDGTDESEYAVMELLERLETLREDMEDLGVTTLDEVSQRIEELHLKLDKKY